MFVYLYFSGFLMFLCYFSLFILLLFFFFLFIYIFCYCSCFLMFVYCAFCSFYCLLRLIAAPPPGWRLAAGPAPPAAPAACLRSFILYIYIYIYIYTYIKKQITAQKERNKPLQKNGAN